MVLHLIAALLGSFLVILPPPPVIDPGKETAIDIEEIGETVLDIDPLDLVDALEDGFPESALPDAFVNPPPGEPSILEDLLGGPLFDFSEDPAPGQVGEASFAFDTDEDEIRGLISGGGVGYLVLDHEVTRGEMRLLEVGFEAGFEEEENTTLDVANEDLGGVDTVSVSVSSDDAGAVVVLHLYMVPVGNVLVMAWVMVTDFREVDADVVHEHAHDLALAAVLHLESVAEDVA